MNPYVLCSCSRGEIAPNTTLGRSVCDSFSLLVEHDADVCVSAWTSFREGFALVSDCSFCFHILTGTPSQEYVGAMGVNLAKKFSVG